MNSYTVMDGRVVAAPRLVKVANKDHCEVRVADNPLKKTRKDGTPIKSRFVTLKFWEFQARLAAKLSKGDVLTATGELGIESFKNREGIEQDKDVVVVDNFKVHKSETFYDRSDAPVPSETPPPAADDDIPF